MPGDYRAIFHLHPNRLGICKLLLRMELSNASLYIAARVAFNEMLARRSFSDLLFKIIKQTTACKTDNVFVLPTFIIKLDCTTASMVL